MTNIDRAAQIIERATRGAHTADGHPMKMSDHTAMAIAEALADDGALVNDQWEYAAIELRPNPFYDDPDGRYWSEPQWWHPTEQDALDDLKTEFMQWRYGTSVAARIIRRPKPHDPELVRTLHPNPHRKDDRMSWSPADDYDDQGNYAPGPTPTYPRFTRCQPGCCTGTPICYEPEGDPHD